MIMIFFFVEEEVEEWSPRSYYLKLVPDVYKSVYYGFRHFNYLAKEKEGNEKEYFIISVLENKKDKLLHCLKTTKIGYEEYDLVKKDGEKFTATKVLKQLELTHFNLHITKIERNSELEMQIRDIELRHRQKKIMCK